MSAAKVISFGPSIVEKAEKAAKRSSDQDTWLELPEAAMYGHLKEIAASMRVPMTQAYCACLVVAAGTQTDLVRRSHELQTNLFSFHIGPPEDGKSSITKNAVKAVTGASRPPQVKTVVPVSDRGLIEMFRADEDPKTRQLLGTPACLLRIDESSILVERIKLQGSTLGQTLCTLYYEPVVGVSDKKGTIEANVQLSILACLPIKDTSEFSDYFSHESTKGFYSRILVVPPAKPGWDLDDQWTPTIQPKRPVTTSIPPAIFGMKNAWRKAGEASGRKRNRAAETALRIACITSAWNGDKVVTETAMTAALAFVEWQEHVKERYTASEARNDDARITEALMTEFENYRRADGRPEWFNFRKLNNNKHWATKYGSSHVTRVRDSMLRDGTLEQEFVEVEKGMRPKPTGKYKLHDRYFEEQEEK